MLCVTFINEATPEYHDRDTPLTPLEVLPAFTTDYDNFTVLYNDLIEDGGSFIGLNYPITFSDFSIYSKQTWDFLQHTLSCMKCKDYTVSETNSILKPDVIPDSYWLTIISELQNNVYSQYPIGLEDMGWDAITNRSYHGEVGEVVITPEQFSLDINKFLNSQGTSVSNTIEEVVIDYLVTEFFYVEGVTVQNPIKSNASWTASFSLKTNTWTSFHSYLPYFYLNTSQNFFSWIPTIQNSLWKHNIPNKYQTYYGTLYPFVLEYISDSNPIISRIFEDITLLTEAKKFDITTGEFVDLKNVTFNKLIAYNSRQCSGLLNIVPKDNEEFTEDYMSQQVDNISTDSIIADRTERNWSLNNLRDIRIDYNKPMFISDLSLLQDNYFTDKILNEVTIDYEKDWSQMESFRDKYLVVRLIFDNFADVKLLMNFSVENETKSIR